LALGSPVMIDLGPVISVSAHPGGVTLEYEGDVGQTTVFGGVSQNPEAAKLALAVESAHRLGAELWRGGATGQLIYQRIQELIEGAGYRWVETVCGHRVSDFPHQKYTKAIPGSLKIPRLDWVPTAGRWVLEVQAAHPTLPLGAFYEDLLA
jgi:methionine aminopeptidase